MPPLTTRASRISASPSTFRRFDCACIVHPEETNFAAPGFLVAVRLAAQSPCSYRDCALAIVPIQFAADGALSRAAWWHDLRFAR